MSEEELVLVWTDKTTVAEVKETFMKFMETHGIDGNLAEVMFQQKYAFFQCPKQEGKRIRPQECNQCDCGHMGECHYPMSCEEAKCQFFYRNEMQNLFLNIYNKNKGVN